MHTKQAMILNSAGCTGWARMVEGIVALHEIAGAVVVPDVLGLPVEPQQQMMVLCEASCVGHEPRF
jgi:hypothetical protein